MNKNFRLTSALNELDDIISSIRDKKIDLMLWQNIAGEKHILQGSLKSHSYKAGQLTIDFNLAKNSNVKDDEKLYFFCQKKNILIKGKVRLLDNGQVQIKVDKKFYLNEQRALFRMDVTEKNITIVLSRMLEQHEREKKETVILRDLCNDGCGFLIPQSRATQFSVKNNINIEKFGTIELKNPIKGRITHISSVSIGNGINDNQYLVGISFNETVPNIDHFLQMIEFGMTEF